MDEFSNKKIDMTQRELTFIKAVEWDKGWRWGLFVGAMVVAASNVAAILFIKLV